MTARTDAPRISESQMVNLVRNALLVAGQEMGDGDQWPVIKDTIHKLSKDYEDLKAERNVHAELKKHYGDMIAQLIDNLHLCPADARPRAEQMIRDLKDLYEARFDPLDKVEADPASAPPHVQRMIALLDTLEEKE